MATWTRSCSRWAPARYLIASVALLLLAPGCQLGSQEAFDPAEEEPEGYVPDPAASPQDDDDASDDDEELEEFEL